MGSKAVIEVRALDDSDPHEFEVSVKEASGHTQHRVTLSRSDYARLCSGATHPRGCVEAAFRFLLDRESKESILRRFNLTLIGHYFPEFEAQLPRYLAVATTPAAPGASGRKS
jgi:hypothetical protein